MGIISFSLSSTCLEKGNGLHKQWIIKEKHLLCSRHLPRQRSQELPEPPSRKACALAPAEAQEYGLRGQATGPILLLNLSPPSFFQL